MALGPAPNGTVDPTANFRGSGYCTAQSSPTTNRKPGHQHVLHDALSLRKCNLSKQCCIPNPGFSAGMATC